MMMAGAAPQPCPLNCKFCDKGLVECDPVSSLQQVLPGIPNLTETILLRNGNLSAIPSAAFQNFSKLRVLSITWCLVSSLANMTFGTGEGSNLKSLDLSNNRLQSCWVDISAFAGLEKLDELILTNNELDALKKSWFLDLNSLTKLRMSENRIAYLPPRTFESLVKLDHLEIAANRIQYLNTGTFAGLDSLSELDLSRNQILSIDEHTFKPLKALRRLWLVRNRLVTLPSFPEWIENVGLHENPWECTCELVNTVLSIKGKVLDVSSLLCDRPEDLKGLQVVGVGPDICINTTIPGGTVPQARSTRFDPLYSFIGGLFSALIICLIVCFVSKRSKQGRATNPTEHRDDDAYGSHKGAPRKSPVKMGAAPEPSQCQLTSESKQTWATHPETKSLEKGYFVLFESPSTGMRKHGSAASPVTFSTMVLAEGDPDKKTSGAKRTDPGALDKSQGSNQSGKQFLGSAVKSVTKSSERTDGLSKCFTAPDLLSVRNEQQSFNPLVLFAEPTCFRAAGSHHTPENPKCYSTKGLTSTHDDLHGSSAPGLHFTPEDAVFYRTKVLTSTHDDPNDSSAPGLHFTPEDSKCYSSKGHQSTPREPTSFSDPSLHPTSKDPCFYNTQDLKSTHDDLTCSSAPGIHSISEDPKHYSVPNLHLTHEVPKSCSTQGRQPPHGDPSCNSLRDLNSTPVHPKGHSTAVLSPKPEEQKLSSTPGIFPITFDPKCFGTPECIPSAGDFHSTGMLPTTETMGCSDSPSLLPNAQDVSTKKFTDIHVEDFGKENANRIDAISNIKSGLVKYFETRHEENVMDSTTCSEAPQMYSDPVAHMTSIFEKDNVNDGAGQKNLGTKCKTWSTFGYTTSDSMMGKAKKEDNCDDFEASSNPSKRNEDLTRTKHGDHVQCEEFTESLGSGQSTNLTDLIKDGCSPEPYGSLQNGRYTEPSDTLRNCTSAELTESPGNRRSAELTDSQHNGSATELSGEDSTSQRELERFFGSADSLSSHSGDSYDEHDFKESQDLDNDLVPRAFSQSMFANVEKPEQSADGLILTQTHSKRSSIKAKSADHCAGTGSTHHKHLCNAVQVYAERDGQSGHSSKEHKMILSLASDESLRARFWKYHTNCCDEYKPCPTAKNVLRRLKATGRESSNHDSVRMSREQFWEYHTHCCDENKTCPTAKKVLQHLKKAPAGKLSNAYVRLTTERFWKYHRNCCDEYKPCPTAKKVTQHLKTAPSGQVDTEPIQGPPSDMDLLEGNDRLTVNLLVRLSQRMERKAVSPWK